MANTTGTQSVDAAEFARFWQLAETLQHEDGSPNLAALSREMGKPRSTLQGWSVRGKPEPKVEFSQSAFLSGDEPIDEIIARKEKAFARKAEAHAGRQWFEIKINEEAPYGVMLWGDPHLDDDGCNMPLLKRHLAVAAQEGIYSVNMGDSHNNWVGRLERLYAHQEASRNTGKRLVEWFMWDSGATWLCWLVGNHDAWNEGTDFLMRLANRKIPVIDWHAQFQIVHPTGERVRFDASHGRKGSSIWNNLHATLRAAKLGDAADIYCTAHTHNYGLEHLEIPEQQRSCWLAQLRGYKFMDSYALHNNFAEYQLGSSVLAVIDPRPGARTKVQCFEDVEMGAAFLRWLRA